MGIRGGYMGGFTGGTLSGGTGRRPDVKGVRCAQVVWWGVVLGVAKVGISRGRRVCRRGGGGGGLGVGGLGGGGLGAAKIAVSGGSMNASLGVGDGPAGMGMMTVLTGVSCAVVRVSNESSVRAAAMA